MEIDETKYRAGLISILGRPNVGKSTLMNRILQQKVAIMSSTAQTTRNKIQGIFSDDQAQIVFIDTPGVHKPKNKLDDYMENSWNSALKDVDGVLFMVSADEKIGPGDRFILEMLKGAKSPVFLIVNKIDQVNPDDLPGIVESYTSEFKFDKVFPISATNGNNVDELLTSLKDLMPLSPPLYPVDQVSDHPEYFLVSEEIREQLLNHTREEVPHSAAVVIESMNTFKNGKRVIEASIIVERENQKAIIIGKGGTQLKKIGIDARKSIEELLGEKVNLQLWVRVQKKWRDNKSFLNQNGYNFKRIK